MKPFSHFSAQTIDDAVLLLKRYGGKANVIAGGTDILGKMKDRILPTYPESLIDIKTLPGLDRICTDREGVEIGALCTLEMIAKDETIETGYTALSQAAGRAASPHLREMGTIGGNICQDIRCWYYRNQNNRFPCLRKGGGRCYAIDGDNRFHSIFGGSVEKGCYAVHPSDTAPALAVLGSVVRTTKRMIPIDDFFDVKVQKTTVLDTDEIVTEILLPALPAGTRSSFIKFALRASIDFPIVNCAVAITAIEQDIVSAKICLNAVYVKPYRALKAEDFLVGRRLDNGTIEAASGMAVSDAQPMSCNGYMVQIARAMVKKTLLACR